MEHSLFEGVKSLKVQSIQEYIVYIYIYIYIYTYMHLGAAGFFLACNEEILEKSLDKSSSSFGQQLKIVKECDMIYRIARNIN